MLGGAQAGRGQGKAIRLLAQPTSPGPCRGEWAGAETQPGALLDGGRALWAHCSLPTRLAFLPEKLEILFHPELL